MELYSKLGVIFQYWKTIPFFNRSTAEMRRFATILTALALSLSGLVFSPAQANVPADGSYLCATGAPGGSFGLGTYTITNGVVNHGTDNGNRASCSGSVVIPDGVTGIGNQAFRRDVFQREVTSVNIPASVTSIGDQAFMNSKITSITIPQGVLTIGNNAFDGSTITSITIPASVTSLGTAVFANSQLNAITFASGSQITSIPNQAFQVAQKLASITIPASVTSIGAQAFANTKDLTSITIPATVTSIGESAFNDAAGLTSITFASGSQLASIGSQAFVSSSIASITIPASVTSIGNNLFSNDFGQYPRSLTDITVEPANPNYSSIDGALFNKSATTLIQYPSQKSSTTYSVPAGVTTIGNNAFGKATNLTSVSIPASVTTIGTAAFRQATALTSVNIPSGVTSIGSNAFNTASALANVTFTGDAAPTVGSDAFLSVPSTAKACVKPDATGFTATGSPARWNRLTVAATAYLASFNSNGGSAITAVSYLANGEVAAPTEPTKAGYTFAGWSTTDGGARIDFPHSPSATCGTTLFAKWDLIPVVNEPAPAANNPAPAAQAAPAPAAPTNVVSVKSSLAPKSLAAQVGVTTVSPKATVTLSVASSSKKFCTKSGSKLKTLKAGPCVVTFTVQEPTPKKGKKPKATKTTKTLVVQ